ncbi:cyclin-SDS-like [Raphanus sativus]|uniref:Cyclin-SDS-like n=1 Tax=Raphanus sativus TaxID=3726 RepID=A0A6J0JMX7_RAPSA|nr:cyclin-SDS-like [Raphanus sativus]
MKEIASRNSKRKAEATPFAVKRALISPVSAASVDSCSNLLSAVDDSVSCGSSRVERSSKLKKIRIEEEVVSPLLTKEKEIAVSESSSFTRSDVTFAERNKESDVVSGVDSCSKFGGSVTGGGGGGGDNEETEISKPNGLVEITGCVSDTFSDEEISDYRDDDDESSSEILSQYSDLGSSDYTSSFLSDSGSEFSERSSSDSPLSHTRSLYLQYKEQFCRSTIPNHFESSLQERSPETQSELVRFEDEEVEERYQRLRERERGHAAYLRDYAKAYCSRMEDHTDFIPQLRFIMVQWIVEQCSAMELPPETLFLGVSLLDRFLSKGSFKSERTLVLVGISSLTLATRIEENQPYNSIRRRNFYIQNLKYSRQEVVAMEWLVQEVLNFKCFSPTIFNFLWFYLKVARANPEVEKKAKLLAINSLSDHTQLCFWPSTVAAGLVVLACIEYNKISAYHRVVKVHVRTKDNDLPECVNSLEWLLEQ